MLSQYLSLNLQQQLSQITKHGFCVMDNFISPTNILALAAEINLLNATSQMQIANTGRVPSDTNSNLRGDSIFWLNEAEASPAQQAYFEKMEDLRCGLNQRLYLGLFSLESHLALYPIGAGYQKHLDQFIGQEDRKVSAILYLNQEWKSEDGGQLRIYLDKTNDHSTIDISPEAGTLVVFLSRDFLHEVLPAKRERLSITGWFRTRNITSTT